MITKNLVRIYLPLVDVNHIQAVLTPEITDAVVFLIPGQFCIFFIRSTSSASQRREFSPNDLIDTYLCYYGATFFGSKH